MGAPALGGVDCAITGRDIANSKATPKSLGNMGILESRTY
jgi:hypothetical protein